MNLGAYAMPVEGGGGELSTTEQAAAKIQEFHYEFTRMLEERRAAYDRLRSAPLSPERDAAVREFNEQEGVLTQYVFPGVARMFEMLGYETPSANLPGTLGLLPVAYFAIVAVKALPWVTLAAAAAIAASLIGYIVVSRQRYDAILQNPKIAEVDRPPSAPYNPVEGVTSTISSTVKIVAFGALAVFALQALLPAMLAKRSS